jgi:hypothetical protein
MGTLKVGDLTSRDRERVKKNHETYKMLYKQCVDHIRRLNDMGTTSTTYFVSEYVLGRPLFTHSHAIRYIVEKLERGKFYVEVDPVSKHLIIDWGAEKQKQVRRKVPGDLGIDARRFREGGQSTRKARGEESIALGSKKKEKRKKHVPIQEPLSMRISRLNAALSLTSKR